MCAAVKQPVMPVCAGKLLTLSCFLRSFFLEKNMFVFFLNILRQKSGRYVCVQLLQTLNILFENISHETSLCKHTPGGRLCPRAGRHGFVCLCVPRVPACLCCPDLRPQNEGLKLQKFVFSPFWSGNV